MDEAFQRAIAGHELLHVARRDWIFNLGEELILTVFWFHPAVAWVVNRIRLSREQTVDAEVVRLISARKPYMSALLEIASSGTGLALGAAPTFLREHQLAQRIELAGERGHHVEAASFLVAHRNRGAVDSGRRCGSLGIPAKSARTGRFCG